MGAYPGDYGTVQTKYSWQLCTKLTLGLLNYFSGLNFRCFRWLSVIHERFLCLPLRLQHVVETYISWGYKMVDTHAPIHTHSAIVMQLPVRSEHYNDTNEHTCTIIIGNFLVKRGTETLMMKLYPYNNIPANSSSFSFSLPRIHMYLKFEHIPFQFLRHSFGGFNVI